MIVMHRLKLLAMNKEKEVINGRTYYDGILIVNKTTKLPSDYNPGEKPKAQRALQRMFTDAEKMV